MFSSALEGRQASLCTYMHAGKTHIFKRKGSEELWQPGMVTPVISAGGGSEQKASHRLGRRATWTPQWVLCRTTKATIGGPCQREGREGAKLITKSIRYKSHSHCVQQPYQCYLLRPADSTLGSLCSSSCMYNEKHGPLQWGLTPLLPFLSVFQSHWGLSPGSRRYLAST